jgi:hypothetical protein
MKKNKNSAATRLLSFSLVVIAACQATDDEPSQAGVEVEVREASAVVRLESGTVLTFSDDGDGVAMLEDGKLGNAPVMVQPELADATAAEVFWALVGDEVEMPGFLLRNHDALVGRGVAAEWDAVTTARSGGWLREELDGDHAFRAAADCVNGTFNAIHCTPNAGYDASTCHNDTTIARTTTTTVVDKFRAGVCGEGGSFTDRVRYQRQALPCNLDTIWFTAWNETISVDEYKIHSWTSPYDLTWPFRKYEHTSSNVGAGDSYDWGSMWALGTCVN